MGLSTWNLVIYKLSTVRDEPSFGIETPTFQIANIFETYMFENQLFL